MIAGGLAARFRSQWGIRSGFGRPLPVDVKKRTIVARSGSIGQIRRKPSTPRGNDALVHKRRFYFCSYDHGVDPVLSPISTPSF